MSKKDKTLFHSSDSAQHFLLSKSDTRQLRSEKAKTTVSVIEVLKSTFPDMVTGQNFIDDALQQLDRCTARDPVTDRNGLARRGLGNAFGIVQDPTGFGRDRTAEQHGRLHRSDAFARHAHFVEDVPDVQIGHTIEDEAKRAFVAVIDEQHQRMIEKWATHRWCCDEESRCE